MKLPRKSSIRRGGMESLLAELASNDQHSPGTLTRLTLLLSTLCVLLALIVVLLR